VCCQVIYYYVVLSVSREERYAEIWEDGLTRLEGALELVGFRIARGVVSVEVDAMSIMRYYVLILYSISTGMYEVVNGSTSNRWIWSV
jgi:hypothetical protein